VATVFVPAGLRRLTGGAAHVTAAGATLREVVQDVEHRFPGFRDAVLEGDEIAPSIAVSIDGDVVAGALSEPVGPHSEVHFIPPMSGG
jgi:molybdopterin synthase sulfur carrier subunit